MEVVVIGKGRVAESLLPALKEAGHMVINIDSHTLEGLPHEADLFILAVKDDAIADVANRAIEGRTDQFFVHTAGSMPLSLLGSLVRRSGVFYPMQTFSRNRRVDFHDVTLFIEASDRESLVLLQQLALSLSPRVRELSSDERQYLHIAAVMACNFSNHCYRLAAEVLANHGIDFETILPLIDETTRKVHNISPAEAQTGPAARHDTKVISHHLELLSGYPIMQNIYRTMSESIMKEK